MVQEDQLKSLFIMNQEEEFQRVVKKVALEDFGMQISEWNYITHGLVG